MEEGFSLMLQSMLGVEIRDALSVLVFASFWRHTWLPRHSLYLSLRLPLLCCLIGIILLYIFIVDIKGWYSTKLLGAYLHLFIILWITFHNKSQGDLQPYNKSNKNRFKNNTENLSRKEMLCILNTYSASLVSYDLHNLERIYPG